MLDMPKSIDPEQAIENEIAVAVTISTQVSERRQIVMQTYLPRDAAIEMFHQTIDKLTTTVDRQEAKQQLEEHKIHLVAEQKNLKQLEQDYLNIEIRNAEQWKARQKKGDP